MTAYVHDPSDPHSLSNNNVNSFYEDRHGVLWVGTEGGGLNKIVHSPDRWFQSLVFDPARPDRPPEVTSVLEDRAGRLWMGTRGGLVYQYDASETTPLTTSIRLSVGVINGLYEDHAGMIWMGTDDGLYRWNPRMGAPKHDLDTTLVSSVYEDADSVLWVATWSGLFRLDRSTDTFINYQHDANDPGSLGSNSILDLYEDRHGMLWIMTSREGSLNRYDADQDRFTSFLLKDVTANTLYEDSRGQFWVGTYGQGLLQFDQTTGDFKAFTTDDGLPHNIIGGIAEDDQGYLWIVTAGGLSRFDPADESFVNFTEADGFPNTMTDPEADELLKSRTGKLFVGGNKGLTIVSPDQLVTNPHPPNVFLTGLQVFDEPFQETGLVPSSVRLAHDRNDLTFEYVGLHFARPEKNRYAYQLEGYDESWREVGTAPTARYTNLDPGNYVFRVKAANSDGVWNEEGATLALTILPPWWRTAWAYLLYGLFFLGGVFAADRFQRKRLIAKEREKARERELEQAREIEKAHQELQQSHAHLKATQAQLVQSEKMASLGQLTAGIAHEIKNPLNFVNNFADLNDELFGELLDHLATQKQHLDPNTLEEIEDVLGYLKINTAKIHEQGRRADSIVKSMMQHASGGSGAREPTDVNALVEEYFNLAYHGMRAQNVDFNVTMEQDYGDDVGTVEMVPQDIGRVLINLFNNAFYAVYEKYQALGETYEPTVYVSTRQDAGTVVLKVHDNGPGIAEAVREKILEPFYTTKPTGSGTGLGLSLTYDIITQGHGGTLSVESTEGEGATFIVTLPAP